jgi:hypothetical protein
MDRPVSLPPGKELASFAKKSNEAPPFWRVLDKDVRET